MLLLIQYGHRNGLETVRTVYYSRKPCLLYLPTYNPRYALGAYLLIKLSESSDHFLVSSRMDIWQILGLPLPNIEFNFDLLNSGWDVTYDDSKKGGR